MTQVNVVDWDKLHQKIGEYGGDLNQYFRHKKIPVAIALLTLRSLVYALEIQELAPGEKKAQMVADFVEAEFLRTLSSESVLVPAVHDTSEKTDT